MNISNIQSFNPYDASVKQQTGNLLTKAIKDYKDEYLSGLTDEEREKIEKEIKAYLDSVPEAEKVNLDELQTLVASLLSKYGYKGDIDAMTKTLIGGVQEELKQEASKSSAAATAYDKLSAATTLKRQEAVSNSSINNQVDLSSEDTSQISPDGTPDQAEGEEETISHTITNPDGSKSIVVMKNKVIMATYKLTQTGDILLEHPSENDMLQNTLTEDNTSPSSTH